MNSDMDYLLQDYLDSVHREVNRARKLHPKFNSAHEGYAVILEQLDELKEEVWKKESARSKMNMRSEAVQVAAMAIRFLMDVC